MLKKKNRLTVSEFSEVFNHGKTIHGNLVYVKYLVTNAKESKFSIVVSKKIQKGAFARNKTRRQMYQLIRNIEKNLEKTVAMVIFIKKTALPLQKELVLQDIYEIFKKTS